MKKVDCLIVGAGMAAIACASKLKEAGLQTILLEKSRGVGGRICTRRFADRKFNHGAQYITARTTEFAKELLSLEKAGSARIWFEQLASDKGPIGPVYPRYVGTSGISSIPKALAENLEIIPQAKVSGFNLVDNRWEVLTADDNFYTAENLVLTPPAPQVLDLLEKSEVELRAEHWQALRSITYDKCIALMYALGNPADVPEYLLANEPLSWISSDVVGGPGLTVHCSSQFSEQYFAADEIEIDTIVQKALGVSLSVKQLQVQRWRYSIPKHSLDCEFLACKNKLFICGEGFSGARVEGAYTSGVACAEGILKLRS